METIKNFFIGLVVVVMALIIVGLFSFTWPVLLGITSLLLSILAVILFIILVFYIIVLVGHITRRIIQKKKTE